MGPQFIIRKISRKLYKTRKHSSRMCAVRSSSRTWEGCLPGEGVSAQRVSAIGVCPGGVIAWGCPPGQAAVCLDGRSGQGVSTYGDVCPEDGGVYPRGVSGTGAVSAREGVACLSNQQSTSGWYASYWNAFLLQYQCIRLHEKLKKPS